LFWVCPNWFPDPWRNVPCKKQRPSEVAQLLVVKAEIEALKYISVPEMTCSLIFCTGAAKAGCIKVKNIIRDNPIFFI
jgi:hypothetical protein